MYGTVGYDIVRYGKIRMCTVRKGTDVYGTVGYDIVRYGKVRMCTVRLAMKLYGKDYVGNIDNMIITAYLQTQLGTSTFTY